MVYEYVRPQGRSTARPDRPRPTTRHPPTRLLPAPHHPTRGEDHYINKLPINRKAAVMLKATRISSVTPFPMLPSRPQKGEKNHIQAHVGIRFQYRLGIQRIVV